MTWREQAACQGLDDIFLPGPNYSLRDAKQICDTCPVQDDCLNYALSDSAVLYGVWAGLSARRIGVLRRELGVLPRRRVGRIWRASSPTS